VGLLTAGAAIEWFSREIGGKATIPELVEEASSVDQAVPVFLPHLIRSLTPHPDAQACKNGQPWPQKVPSLAPIAWSETVCILDLRNVILESVCFYRSDRLSY
jgi:hypothetical protein